MTPESFPDFLLSARDRQAGEYLRSVAGGPIDVLVVLGSGLADTLEQSTTWAAPDTRIRLDSIPGVIAPCADGHLNDLYIYRKDKTIAVALGRTHLYEGLGPNPVTALERAAACAGVSAAILCNANGCLRDWHLGDVMAIDDHANFTGVSPFDGTIFLDTTACWDPQLTDILAGTCQRRGSYGLMRGPEYQTRLETQILANSGVDCVGMSTVMEALMLHALGVKVCGMSVVSDLSFSDAPTDPAAVITSATGAEETVLRGIDAVLAAL